MIASSREALEVQTHALTERIAMLEREITVKTQQQSQAYEISEQRKEEAVGMLRGRIEEVSHELTLITQELHARDEQINQLKGILAENHELLAVERKERTGVEEEAAALQGEVERVRIELSHREGELQASVKKAEGMMERMVEAETRYDSLRRRCETTEQEKALALREVENQGVSIRVLREENQNIEKVLSEQLSQRKQIIEQLVSEKRMLYSQLQRA